MSLVNLEDELSPILSNPPPVDAFRIIIAPQIVGNLVVLRDRCFCLILTYNDNYDLTKPLNLLNKADYL